MQKFAFFLLFMQSISSEKIICKTEGNIDGNCVLKRLCKVDRLNQETAYDYTSDEIDNSQCGDTLICCAKDKIKDTNVLLAPPGYCGVENLTIISGNSTKNVIVENPWQALLIRNNGGLLLCSGVVINVRFVLTRAHCLYLHIPFLIRIGNWDFALSTDCDVIKPFFNIITDFGVADIIIHENYNRYTSLNDIGLVRLNRDVDFTQFIRPICLPFNETVETLNNTNIQIGSYDLLYRSKQQANAIFLPNNLCKTEFDNHIFINKEILSTHICINATNTLEENDVFGEYLTYIQHTTDDNKKFKFFLSFLINRNHNDLPQYGELIYAYLIWIKGNLYI